ncbi:MAG TPA: chlorite dismutase family protein [Rectinemataceae bacterium]|nr:chlorite dismutase family protein [Rectinemataceae bacterium]
MDGAQQIDLREKGRAADGSTIYSERRLYLQFLAFGNCPRPEGPIAALAGFGHPSVLYADLADPRGIGLVFMSEDPAFFARELREFLAGPAFAELSLKPELSMFGRTYAIGYERDLEETLFTRPRSRILDPELAWATWYPVRRSKAFAGLPEAERHDILMDHGEIGKRFGKAGLAHDIRLDCHGLDRNDNDFVIGIVSKELVAISAVVEAMRGSLQTMRHLDNLGPFFTGMVLARRGL